MHVLWYVLVRVSHCTYVLYNKYVSCTYVIVCLMCMYVLLRVPKIMY